MKDQDKLHDAASTLGRSGGMIGGRRRAEVLSPERRREIAKLAANARWSRIWGASAQGQQTTNNSKKGQIVMITKEDRNKVIEAMRVIIASKPGISQTDAMREAVAQTGVNVLVSHASASQYAARMRGDYVVGTSKVRKPVAEILPSSQIKEGEELIRQGIRRMEEERTALQKRLLELDDLMAKHRKWL